MKLFSNFLASIAMLLMLSLATSCDNPSEQPNTPSEPEYVTVSLGLNVKLDCEYEPLTRAEENNDLYGIQVYSTPYPATENAEWKEFAYGLFDTTDNLTIKLIRGYEYKFVATMVKDGKEKIQSDDRGYCNPFCHRINDNGYIEPTPLSMTFFYGRLGYVFLESGYTDLKNTDQYRRPNVERYYGELERYTPGENDSKATIELERHGFGAKYKVAGEYAANGTLEILMDKAPQLNLNLAESNEVSEIYTFRNIREAWLDENYTEIKSVVLRIAYSDGSTAPLGTHNITFKRNMTTVVNVDLTVGGENGVGIVVTEEGEMPEGDEITIKDGEIIDTEIEAN